MKKKYLAFIFLIFPLTLSSDFLYDSENDIVYFNNRKYVQIDNPKFQLKTLQFNKIGEDNLTISDGATYWYYLISIICKMTFKLVLTLFAGLMSGLTVGYLSIDDLVMELKTSTGSSEEKAQANIVLPILAHRHWLLCTLLVSNAAAMETLPLLLNYLVPEYLAIIISVTLVLTFGEIIPQAICTGPDQIKIASGLAPLTKVRKWLK